MDLKWHSNGCVTSVTHPISAEIFERYFKYSTCGWVLSIAKNSINTILLIGFFVLTASHFIGKRVHQDGRKPKNGICNF